MTTLFGIRFEKFDAHLKAVEGVNQQTVLGAILTIISTILVIALLYAETSAYMRTDLVSRMVTDSTLGHASARIVFDLDFPYIQCPQLDYVQELTRGSEHQHTTMPTHVEKLSIGENKQGCRVFGNTLTDNVGGILKFKVDPPSDNSNSMAPPNLSHTISSLMILPVGGKIAGEDHVPGFVNPLNGKVTVAETNDGIYHYSIQAVPTEYTDKGGALHKVNQYSVSELQVDFIQAIQGVIIGNQAYQGFVGVVFDYDFYPVRF